MREKYYMERLEELISNYHGEIPLSIYLRQEFHKRRNMGSRDRRRTREDVYNYFRIGRNFIDLPVAIRVAIGGYICNTKATPELDFIISNHTSLSPSDIGRSIEYKLSTVNTEYPQFNLNSIFPLRHHISNLIDKEKFIQSFLQQPLLWIRIRKQFRGEVLQEINTKQWPFRVSEFSPLALSLENSTPVHELESYSKGYFEIQDINSQRCASDFSLLPGEFWWDCCAGSGGKSLLLLDREPGLKITATDTRESSLQNLRLRLKKADLKIENVQQMDLRNGSNFKEETFDGILADVPCSGSGTWARTPEMLFSFKEEDISSHYVLLQRKLIQNLTPALKKNGKLIYITCSVFVKENEENINYFMENLKLKCLSSGYHEGSVVQADTMFIAVLQKIGG